MATWKSIAGGILAATFVLMGVRALQQDDADRKALIANVDAQYNLKRELNPEFKGWRYATEVDKMRGTSDQRAELLANDYNPDLTPKLILYRLANGRKVVAIAGALSESGTVQCNSPDSKVAIKVDDKPIQQISCRMGSPVPLDASLFKIIKNSKVLMLEIGNGQGGTSQFTFNTGGLKL